MKMTFCCVAGFCPSTGPYNKNRKNIKKKKKNNKTIQLYRVCFQEHQQFPLILVGINTSQIFSLFERADFPSDMSWIFSNKIN